LRNFVVFLKKSCTIHHFPNAGKKNSEPGEIYRPGLMKTLSSSRGEVFELKVFVRKKIFVFGLGVEKNQTFARKKFFSVLKTAFYVSIDFCRKNFGGLISYFYSEFQQKYSKFE